MNIDEVSDLSGFDLGKLLDDAESAALENDQTKREFLSLASTSTRLYKAVLPDTNASEFTSFISLLYVLTERIRNRDPEVDISGVMEGVNRVLDQSITARSFVMPEEGKEDLVDLSRVDFEALKKRFEQGRQRIEAEKLRGRASTKLKEMVRLNKTRADYQERLQRLIDEYNSGSLNLETYFENLLALVQDLAEEDRRTISEGLTEEELALFDILTRPEIPLAEKEKDEVKRLSRNLLETLKKGKLVLDWRKRQQSRASVRVAIELGLDELPESFTDRMYWSKVETVYQHVYDSYYGSGKSLYSTESIN